MDLLSPVLFTDSWGSHTFLASLQGRPIPSTEPESELWMGAHEAGPAALTRSGRATTLLDLVQADPEAELGPDCRRRFGDRLPFLLKILAPGRAISIQVHPRAEQARAERARSGSAIYVDDWAKPELLLAISTFDVFIGMRRHEEVTAVAQRLRVPRFTDVVRATAGANRPEHALLEAILDTPPEEVADFAREVVAACVLLEVDEGDLGRTAAALVAVAEDHPDDIGLVVLLLMHHHVLAPGEYLDVAAGVLHSYVRGLGIEVLANSDNVVRAGLTAKEVNTAELLRIVDPGARVAPAVGVERVPGVVEFASTSDRFRLNRISPGRALPQTVGPRIVLCFSGRVVLTHRGERLTLRDLESAFLPAGTGEVNLTGDGEVFCVLVPEESSNSALPSGP